MGQLNLIDTVEDLTDIIAAFLPLNNEKRKIYSRTKSNKTSSYADRRYE